jgi:hypothetical protein
MPRISFQDIADQMKHVDDPDVLEKVKGNPALRLALDMSRPVNWRGTGIKPEAILAVAIESGIPVAWVPPPGILSMLVAAGEKDRMAILRTHSTQILDQCDQLLNKCRDWWLHNDRVLIGRAVHALKEGHHEAAMALAVAVGESLALWASKERLRIFDSEAEKKAWEEKNGVRKYNLAEIELTAVGTGQELKRWEVLRHALIAPIPKFFTPFYGRPGETVPDTVSRHVTVHRPTVAHLTRDNALLAIMLCVSILREQQTWREEIEDEEAFGEWLAQQE